MYNIYISTKVDYHENQRAISAKHDISTIIICKPRYFFCTTFTLPTPLRQLDRFGLSFETPNKLLGFIDAMVQPDDSIKAREAGGFAKHVAAVLDLNLVGWISTC